MAAKRVKVKMQSQDSIFRPEIKKIIFPKIYDIENLPVDKNLEPVEVISPIINKVSSVKKFQISFNLQVTNLTTDVFLYLNGRKLDMYYSIPSGRYSLKFFPKKGKNVVEIFYLVNDCKSPSAFNTFVSK